MSDGIASSDSPVAHGNITVNTQNQMYTWPKATVSCVNNIIPLQTSSWI